MSVGNAGYGAVRDVDGLRAPAVHVEFDPVVAGVDMRAGLLELASTASSVFGRARLAVTCRR